MVCFWRRRVREYEGYVWMDEFVGVKIVIGFS